MGVSVTLGEGLKIIPDGIQIHRPINTVYQTFDVLNNKINDEVRFDILLPIFDKILIFQ